MVLSDKYTLFWGGPFSQWYPSPFTDNGIRYNCAEQFMMHMKAIIMGDMITAEKIMQTDSPPEQKRLGRQVANFDKTRWEAVMLNVVLVGSLQKYIQNPDLLAILKSTKGTKLVEASPYDTVWGIGLGENDPDALDERKWKGTNFLGKTLDNTRTILMNY